MRWSPWEEVSSYPYIRIQYLELDEGRGWWCPDYSVIVLDSRLDPVTARCVLAHELGHAVQGHVRHPEVPNRLWYATRIEASANHWAAIRLMPIDELVVAVAEHHGDPVAMAEHLEVTTQILDFRLARLTASERHQLAQVGGRLVGAC